MAEIALRSLLNSIEDFLIDEAAQDYYFGRTSVYIEIPDDDGDLKSGNQVERVPPLLRNKESHRDVYDPVIVSMGPYFHGKPEYHHAESFKKVSLEAFVSGTQMPESFFYDMILDKITDIHANYEHIDSSIDDNKLARLVLCDACFFIYYVKNQPATSSLRDNKFNAFYKYFGPARIKFIFRDLILVENQIPFWIIELLMSYSHEGLVAWDNMLCKFMDLVIAGDVGDLETLPWIENNKPLHFLGAYYQALKVQIPVRLNSSYSALSMAERNPLKSNTYRFRSITNLKAKGIHFKLSKPTQGFNIISFNSYKFYGQLHLPPLVLSSNFFVLYSNLIAYEMSPTSNTDFFVSSLVNLLKSLIDSPSDVKILREEGILINDMISDEEVVKVIKDLDTYGLENVGAFSELRDSIEKHCCSKAKTWAAELVHTYFESPWNTIALLAAILLVLLTCIQTYYARNPVS